MVQTLDIVNQAKTHLIGLSQQVGKAAQIDKLKDWVSVGDDQFSM